MKNITIILTMLIFLVPTLHAAETIPELDLDQLFAGKRALVKEHLQLTDKESAVFWPLYDDYVKAQINSLNKWEALLNGYLQEREHLSEKSAKEMITKMFDLQTEDAEIKRAHYKKFNKKLSHKTAFKYFIFEERLDAVLSDLVTEVLFQIK